MSSSLKLTSSPSLRRTQVMPCSDRGSRGNFGFWPESDPKLDWAATCGCSIVQVARFPWRTSASA